MKYVRLEDETGGWVYDDDVKEGDLVTVRLHDENGMPIEIGGNVVEIFEEE
jgi:hypothetical protein